MTLCSRPPDLEYAMDAVAVVTAETHAPRSGPAPSDVEEGVLQESYESGMEGSAAEYDLHMTLAHFVDILDAMPPYAVVECASRGVRLAAISMELERVTCRGDGSVACAWRSRGASTTSNVWHVGRPHTTEQESGAHDIPDTVASSNCVELLGKDRVSAHALAHLLRPCLPTLSLAPVLADGRVMVRSSPHEVVPGMFWRAKNIGCAGVYSIVGRRADRAVQRAIRASLRGASTSEIASALRKGTVSDISISIELYHVGRRLMTVQMMNEVYPRLAMDVRVFIFDQPYSDRTLPSRECLPHEIKVNVRATLLTPALFDLAYGADAVNEYASRVVLRDALANAAPPTASVLADDDDVTVANAVRQSLFGDPLLVPWTLAHPPSQQQGDNDTVTRAREPVQTETLAACTNQQRRLLRGLKVGEVNVVSDLVETEQALGACRTSALFVYCSDCNFCTEVLGMLQSAAPYMAIPIIAVNRLGIPANRRPFGYPHIVVNMRGNNGTPFGPPYSTRNVSNIMAYVASTLGDDALFTNKMPRSL